MSWPDASYGVIAGIIRERTGLVFPPSRRGEIEQALARALPHGSDPEAIRSLLETDDEAKEALIAELTIGESYFLRDTGQFTLLRELLPRLAAARGDIPIRVWSAGCATGEEPYSVAILSEQLGLTGRVAVFGTDISRARLAHARRGVYRPWSLRGVADDVIDRFFERRGPHFHIRPSLRQRVDFRYLNLAEDRFPSLTAGIWGMDVILCRNVLIYFDRETIARVARGLVGTLTGDGWLVLGASDPAISDLVDVDVVLTKAGLAYRRPRQAGEEDAAHPLVLEPAPPPAPPPETETDLAGAPAAEATPAPVPLPLEAAEPAGDGAAAGAEAAPVDAEAVPVDAEAAPDHDARLAELEHAYGSRVYARAEALAREAIAAGAGGVRPWILLIRALANRGCLAEAGQAAASALERHRESAELLYLHALLLSQSSLHAEAASAARRALYLDRDMIVAHMALSNARARLGDAEGARRALRNADILLGRLSPDAVVPASDGQGAGRLKQMIRAQLSVLAAA